MKLSYEEKSRSIEEVNKFKSDHQLVLGKQFLAKVTFEKLHSQMIADTCDCCIVFNIEYQQYEVIIDWSYSNETLERNSMHRGYNTNFQKIEYLVDSNELQIVDNNIKITIVEGD